MQKTKMYLYEAPVVEIIEVLVEQGMYGSEVSSNGDIANWEPVEGDWAM